MRRSVQPYLLLVALLLAPAAFRGPLLAQDEPAKKADAPGTSEKAEKADSAEKAEPAKKKPETPAPAEKKPAPAEKTDAASPATVDQTRPALPRLPVGIVARVGDREITVEDYSRYLFARYGRSKLDELIDRVLVEQEARRLGIQITPEDVEREVDRRIENTVQAIFRGDRAAFERDLERRGLSADEHRVSLAQVAAYDLLLDSCVVRGRETGEKAIRQRFEELHGDGGVELQLRHLLVEARGESRTRDAAGNPLPPRDEARKSAERILARVRAGVDFVPLVRAYSEDLLTRKNDGRIPVYRKGMFGDQFHKAALALEKENEVSDVVESPRGFHIIQLIGKSTTPFDAKRDEIEEYLATRQPTAAERQALLKKLREAAAIEK